MGVITWGGIKSSDLGIIVELVPDYEIPERNVTSLHSIGSVGDCLIDSKSFKTITRTYHLVMVNKDLSGSYENFVSMITEWLMAPKGFNKLAEDQTLSETTYPIYRIASFNGGIELQNLYGIGLRAEVSFTCYPDVFYDGFVGIDSGNNANGSWYFTAYNTFRKKANADEKIFFENYPKLRIGLLLDKDNSYARKNEWIDIAIFMGTTPQPNTSGFEDFSTLINSGVTMAVQANINQLSDEDYSIFYNYYHLCKKLGYIMPIYYNFVSSLFEVNIPNDGVFTPLKTNPKDYQTLCIPATSHTNIGFYMLSLSNMQSNVALNLQKDAYKMPASSDQHYGFLSFEASSGMNSEQQEIKYLCLDNGDMLINKDRI